jgi:hypothetical protein
MAKIPTFTADYSVKMQDSAGRTCELYVNGASIDELTATGVPEYEAREGVESNAFENAIARGEIGEDAWAV